MTLVDVTLTENEEVDNEVSTAEVGKENVDDEVKKVDEQDEKRTFGR